KTTPRSVQETLGNLPQDLNTAYKDTMQRINQQKTDDRELALAALTWVRHAKRVLKVVELQEALAVKPGATDLRPGDRSPISIILEVCAGLVIVEDTSSTVRLVHYSTQRYLDSHFSSQHTEITCTLLTYLAL
ncbi:hypothetical protein B0H14DRAFT_2212999, partial [Mycena olivaceomarginata]